MYSSDDGPRTTTILTIDLPGDLGQRLRRVMRLTGHRSLSKVALAALEAWVRLEEKKLGDQPADADT